jgi:hypothetical protein
MPGMLAYWPLNFQKKKEEDKQDNKALLSGSL